MSKPSKEDYMQKKLLLSYIAVIVVTMIFAVTLSWKQVNNYFIERVGTETQIESLLIKKLIEETNISEDGFQSFINDLSGTANVRITLIEPDGTVKVDSDNDAHEMDNHANRPEVKEALAGESGQSIRFSNTMKMYFFYYATPISADDFTGVLRVSVPVDEIQIFTRDMIWIILFGLLFGSAIAIGVAYIVTRRLMEPINELTRVSKLITEGNYDEKIYISQKDQIGALAEAFNAMTFRLRKNIWDLSKKNAELESILTSMNSGMAAINMDNKIALVNDMFVKLLGIKDEDVLGKLYYQIVREISIFELVEEAIKEEAFQARETTLNVDDEMKMIRITATPILDKTRNHQVIGTLVMLTDVTQIRKLENMRRDFVSNVTHELKTPLTSIRGFVDTLKNGAISNQEVALRFLDIIDIETERLSALIQDILSLSEIETIVRERNEGEYAISEIIGEVLNIVPKRDKDVEVIVDIPEDLPPFTCNKDRMKQFFINLIDNSLKYTEKGHVRISCYEEYRYLHIEIEDTGIGIEYKHLSRLFERFYRVDKGRSRKMGGTGLGLSIVKHIVELYSGEIHVESEVGKGTTMKIRLPY